LHSATFFCDLGFLFVRFLIFLEFGPRASQAQEETKNVLEDSKEEGMMFYFCDDFFAGQHRCHIWRKTLGARWRGAGCMLKHMAAK